MTVHSGIARRDNVMIGPMFAPFIDGGAVSRWVVVVQWSDRAGSGGI